jgi:hypothetical protein
MKPKLALWLAAALISSAWYVLDPQARSSATADRDPDRPVLSVSPTDAGDHQVASGHDL